MADLLSGASMSVVLAHCTSTVYSVSQKISPCNLQFSDIFHKRWRILNQFFTHVPIYARLQIFDLIISNFNKVMPYASIN